MSGTFRRRYLVLGRVGDKSLHKHWLEGNPEARLWDLALNGYGQDESRIQDGDLPVTIDRGTKLDSIARQLRAQPDWFDRYDYICIPDDDIRCSAHEFNQLFELSAAHNLLVSQASLTHGSYFSHPIVLNVPSLAVRFTNFVEGMTVCFKSEYLRVLLPMFEHFTTGWGVDLVWALTNRHPYKRAAILDAVQVEHTRPMQTGPMYKQFSASGRDPELERETVLRQFRNYQRGKIAYASIDKDGKSAGVQETLRRSAKGLLEIKADSRDPASLRRMARILSVARVTHALYKPVALQPSASAPPWLHELCAATLKT